MEHTKFEIIANKCPSSLRKSEKKEYEEIYQRRTLQKFVNYKISRLCGDTPIDEVIKLDSSYILRSDVEEINKLIRFSEDGIFERHQFRDAKPNLTQLGYNRWYNNTMENTFFFTIKAGDIFNASNYSSYYIGELDRLLDGHSSEEINRLAFSGYSIYRLIKSLDYIDPFLVFSLICKNTKLENIDNLNYVTGVFEKENGEIKKLAANFRDKNLYVFDEKGKLKRLMNIYEFMFKFYRKPIFDVINSVNNEVNYFMCPGEGLDSYSYDKDISASVQEIVKSKTYQRIRMDNVKSFTR